jgi:hypothetical protein
MTSLLWIALCLVALWLVVKFVFKMVGCTVHLLLLLAAAAVIYWLMKGGAR